MINEINRILSDWDPIGVGIPISLDEYRMYASELDRLPPDEYLLKDYILQFLHDIGLDYITTSDTQNREIADVVSKILNTKASL